MTQLYEGMFLLDNRAVRTDWRRSKAAVTDALAKHDARLISARRWDERRLSYTIRGNQRATYLLAFFEQGPEGSLAVRRDLDLEERVLRYLIQRVEEVPQGEVEHSQAELEAGFEIPLPPSDDELPSSEQAAPGEVPAAEEPVEEEAEEVVVEEEKE